MVTVQIGRVTLGVANRRWRVLDDGGQPHLAGAIRDRLNIEARALDPTDPHSFGPGQPSPDLVLARRAVAGRSDARILDEGDP